MVGKLLNKHYGLNAISIEKASEGAGSDTYFANCDKGRYVIKFPSENEMNNPEAEPELCDFLLKKGISVCRFVRNNEGCFISRDDNGRAFHVQDFISGKTYDWNCAPDFIITESAEMLGKIHNALEGYEGLPVGIGADFFRFMTPENALRSYKRTLITAKENGDEKIISDLHYRTELMKRFPEYRFDAGRLTCKATHGDYFISQLICGEKGINAVIDWTTACVHPVVWELMRSYVYTAPECAEGRIDTDRLRKYFASYMKYSPLNEYDLDMAVKLFFYQIAVCDYYGQYYASTAVNREIFLRQAVFSTRLMKWFDENGDRIKI